MVTQQTPPKPDALERQRKRQMRHTMNRRLGGFAAAAAVIGVAVFLTVRASGGGAGQPGEGTPSPSVEPSVTPPAGLFPPVSMAPWVTGAAPDSDYFIDVNTGEMTRLPQAITDALGPAMTESRYAVSPDGSTLAFVGVGDGDSVQIFLAGVDGSDVRQVTHDPRSANTPAWSPDGTKIAYEGHAREDGGGNGIYVLDVATGEATAVIDVPNGSSFAFTPDGASIVYDGGSNEFPMLRTVPLDLDGGKSRVLIGPGEGINDSGNGSISPDGSMLTFLGSGFPESGEVEHCGPCRLIANADGTERRVVHGWLVVPAGVWSPDSSRIVATERDPSTGYRSVIMVVDATTERATIVANGRWAIWVDNDTLLVQV